MNKLSVKLHACLPGLLVLMAGAVSGQVTPELSRPEFTFVPAVGLEEEPGVCRRDPSDVIRVGSTYFVWYTKVTDGPGIYNFPSGYSGDVWYATSEDGRQWEERGEVVGKGPEGAFDEFGVFTPGILVADGKYYLFYDAVPRSDVGRNADGNGDSHRGFTARAMAEVPRQSGLPPHQ